MGHVLDEVHIKEDVVYDKHQGTLIGFTNLGDVNNCLVKFEVSVQNEEPQEQLAKSMFVIMVRGLFNKLNFPYAQFACCIITGDLLMTPVWEAISHLKRQGFKVLSLTCDGASSNRRLWQLHKKDKKKSKKQTTRDPQSDGNAEEDRDDDDTDDIEEELYTKFQMYLLQMDLGTFVTRHEKIGLICTKYTTSHNSTYLTFCESYTSSVNCLKLLNVYCTSIKSFIVMLCLITKL